MHGGGVSGNKNRGVQLGLGFIFLGENVHVLIGGPAQEFLPVFFQKITVGNALSQNSKFWMVIWQDRALKISARQFLILPPLNANCNCPKTGQTMGGFPNPPMIESKDRAKLKHQKFTL